MSRDDADEILRDNLGFQTRRPATMQVDSREWFALIQERNTLRREAEALRNRVAELEATR